MLQQTPDAVADRRLPQICMEELSSLQKEELTLLCFREQSVDGQWATAWGLGGFPEGSDGNKSARRARDLGSAVGWEDPLEKGVANYSRILAWRIPGAEESGELWSQRVTKSQTRLKQLSMHAHKIRIT